MELATRDGFGNGLVKIGANKDMVVLDGDMSDSTRSEKFGKMFPDRFFSLGISEADLVCTAAGMAACGKIPFVATFAEFLTGRAYGQILVSVCYSNMNVKLVGSHAGIATGEDGPTAQCITDISAMRIMPGMSVIVPADATEAEKATEFLVNHKGPAYLRLSRPKSPVIFDDDYNFNFGKALTVKEGGDISIISTGIVLSEAMEAAKILEKSGISAEVINMGTVKPLDKAAVIKAAKKGAIVTCEDGLVNGLGGAVAEVLAENYPTKLLRIGLDSFAESGSYKDLYKKYGLDADGIAKSVEKFVKTGGQH